MEIMIAMIPAENKCWKNKSTGHKFVYNIIGKGLPLYVNYEANEDIEIEEQNKQQALNEFYEIYEETDEKIENEEEN